MNEQFYANLADSQNNPDPRADKYCDMAARLLSEVSSDFEVTFTRKPKTNDCIDRWGFMLRDNTGLMFKMEMSGLKDFPSKGTSLYLTADRPKGFGYSMRREEFTIRGNNLETEIPALITSMINRVFHADPDEEEIYDNF